MQSLVATNLVTLFPVVTWCRLVRRVPMHDGLHVVQEGPLEQVPHVVAGVDLLHLNLRVYVAVVQEAYVCFFHLRIK